MTSRRKTNRRSWLATTEPAEGVLVLPLTREHPSSPIEPDFGAGPDERNTAWMPALIVLGVVAVLVLRLMNMNEFGFNSDEAVYGGQAAALAGVDGFAEKFSVFRAHPLLFQWTLSFFYSITFIDVIGRYVAAGFGLLTIPATYLAGKKLFDHRTGLLAAAFLAVVPYHVVVSRQTLLEAPMALFFVLTIWAYANYREARSLRWAASVGLFSGLTFLSKEVGVIIIVMAFMLMAIEGRHRLRYYVMMGFTFVLTISPHLLASRFSGGGESTGGAGWADYVIWQTSRPSNHPPGFYLWNMPHYFSIPMLVLLIGGLALLLFERLHENPKGIILVTWFLVPILFFQVWKVKGYHYLLPIAPAGAILAAFAIYRIRYSQFWRYPREMAIGAAILAVVVAFGASALNGPLIQNHSRVGDAGYAGIPGAREAAGWVKDNTPEGSRILGIGPSIGNMIKFYGDRETMALSISPNPRRTNPAYEPIRNPDYMLRWGLVEYLIYDEYSADRTPHFANRLLDFVERYGAEIVYEVTAPRVDEHGNLFDAPVIRIYRVAPVGATDAFG